MRLCVVRAASLTPISTIPKRATAMPTAAVRPVLSPSQRWEMMAMGMGCVLTSITELATDVYLSEDIQNPKWKASASPTRVSVSTSFLESRMRSLPWNTRVGTRSIRVANASL